MHLNKKITQRRFPRFDLLLNPGYGVSIFLTNSGESEEQLSQKTVGRQT